MNEEKRWMKQISDSHQAREEYKHHSRVNFSAMVLLLAIFLFAAIAPRFCAAPNTRTSPQDTITIPTEK